MNVVSNVLSFQCGKLKTRASVSFVVNFLISHSQKYQYL